MTTTFTGAPCKHCGNTTRWISNRDCIVCSRQRQIEQIERQSRELHPGAHEEISSLEGIRTASEVAREFCISADRVRNIWDGCRY